MLRKNNPFLIVLLAVITIGIVSGVVVYLKADKNSDYTADAKCSGKQFYVMNKNGEYEEFFINGIDIGASKDGYWPGEFGIEKEDYLRWFKLIAEMNVNTIRVYVAQMPAFYEAFYEYNKSSDEPLYLIQGVYLNEETVAEYSDAFCNNGELVNSFDTDIRNVVDIIHGNAEIEKLPGNAGGSYTEDISRYVIGYIFGIEWSADFVIGTNEKNPDRTSYDGEYVYTQNASPFEVFLAEAADTAITYEKENYESDRPVAMSNWVTTDPLSHPNDPTPETEDAVSVDVEHILAKDGFASGFFASYHVYPYYPEFFNFADDNEQSDDTYLDYLTELNSYHTMPVLIAEYGIPTSRGIAHENLISGYNQGNIDETEQGEILIALNKDIVASGCAGGLIFTWQDEWFKTTWNTTDLEDPDRRPYWDNVQSAEQNFGLLAFDSGEDESVVTVDGESNEWQDAEPLVQNDGYSLYANADEKYLYLMIESNVTDILANKLIISFDTISDQGNTSYGDIKFADATDFVLVLDGAENSRVLVDRYYDVFSYQYSVQTKIILETEGLPEKNSGVFVPINMILCRPLTLPVSREIIPYQSFEAGKLTYGNADPESEYYNSLADFYAKDGVIEIRLPWMLMNVMDPSQKEIIADFYTNEEIAGQTINGVNIGVAAADSQETVFLSPYTWDNWEMPTTHERLKKSYYVLQDYFASL